MLVLDNLQKYGLEKQGEHKFPSLSEKEIVCLKRILDFLREEHNSYTGKDFTNEIAVLEWLITHPVLIHSSELQQNQGEWKPSDEQMEALDDFIYAKYPNIEKHGAVVKSLYQDLKKLKEE